MVCLQVNALDEKTDSNAAKAMALDHLGVIAAKIRTSTLKFQIKANEEAKTHPLNSMEEVTTLCYNGTK